MTNAALYPGLELTNAVDGNIPAAVLSHDECCTDPLCINEEASMCGMLDALPTGPLWDAEKSRVRQIIVASGGVPAGGFQDPSMVVYTAYLGQHLAKLVTDVAQPPVREAFPHTAVTTLDDWLDRLNWVDCYRSTCRAEYLAVLSPYEADGTCGPEYFPTDFTDEFENALKHAILQCLVRSQMGVIKNLAGINWILEPLKVVLQPVQPYPDVVQEFIANPALAEDCVPCFSLDLSLELVNTTNELPGAPTVASFCGDDPLPIAAEQTYIDADGNPILLYPNVIAAECIVRSMMPRPCPNILTRSTAAIPPVLLNYVPAGDPVNYLLGRTGYNGGIGGSTKGAIFTANVRRYLTRVNFGVPAGQNIHVFIATVDASNNITSVLLDSPEVVGYTSSNYTYTLPAPIVLEPGTRFMVAAYRADDAAMSHHHGPNNTDPNGNFTPDPTNRIDGSAADRVVGGNLEAPLSLGRPFGIYLVSESATLVP